MTQLYSKILGFLNFHTNFRRLVPLQLIKVNLTNHKPFLQNPITLSNCEIPLIILGDPAYPSLKWLVKPYIGYNLSPNKESFNTYHSSTRIMIEIAFGRLKGRWRILSKKVDVKIRFVPSVIATCCALHNICESRKVPMSEVQVDVNRYPQPPSRPSPSGNFDGATVRDALKQHIFQTLPFRASQRFADM